MTEIIKKSFGSLKSGSEASLFSMKNGKIEVCVSDFGGAVVSVKTPDKNGNIGDIVLGFDDVSGYENQSSFIGVTVGPYANRIAGGRFSLGGEEYILEKNDGENTLHGGNNAFHKRLWNHSVEGDSLVLSLESPDGDLGFPGNVKVWVKFTLEENALTINYSAVSDKDTVLNLTNHSYFNLDCSPEKGIEEHYLKLPAEAFTRVDETLIPFEIASVEGTPLDFRSERKIGERINEISEDLRVCGGYDHNFILSGGEIELSSKESGRKIRIATDMPAVQFYSGNALNGKEKGKGGVIYQNRAGLCLETQFYPNSPNEEIFPSAILKAGGKYNRYTKIFFETAKKIEN